jgi:ribosome-associated protein
MLKDFKKAAQAAARAASEKKAVDIRVLDLRQQSDIADYIVIAGADSSAQMRAIESSVEEALALQGLRPLRRDGAARDRWLAIDYGGLLLHIMLPDARDFFRLEQMWENPRLVEWEKAPRRALARPAKAGRRSAS